MEIWENLENLSKFGKFEKIWKIWENLENLENLRGRHWKIFHWRALKFSQIFQIFSNFLKFSKFSQIFHCTPRSGSACGRERLKSDSRVASDHQNRHRLHRHNIGLKLCFETGFVNCIWSQIHFGQRRKNVGQRHRVLSIVFVFAYLCRVFACNTPKDVFPRVCVRMFIWWWWWRFWWSKATQLLESSRSRLDLRPRQRQNGKKTNTVENTQIQRQIQNTNTKYFFAQKKLKIEKTQQSDNFV